VDLPDLVAKPPLSMKNTIKQGKGLCKLQHNLVSLAFFHSDHWYFTFCPGLFCY
jgi:hypothetical protein